MEYGTQYLMPIAGNELSFPNALGSRRNDIEESFLGTTNSESTFFERCVEKNLLLLVPIYL